MEQRKPDEPAAPSVKKPALKPAKAAGPKAAGPKSAPAAGRGSAAPKAARGGRAGGRGAGRGAKAAAAATAGVGAPTAGAAGLLPVGGPFCHSACLHRSVCIAMCWSAPMPVPQYLCTAAALCRLLNVAFRELHTGLS